MPFTFLVAQAFLPVVCHMRAYIFFFFAGWIFLIGLFVLFLLPETKNVPIDATIDEVCKQHQIGRQIMDLKTMKD